MANLPLAFAELLVGGVLIDAGIKGASIADVVKGQAAVTPLSGNAGTPNAGQSGSTAGPAPTSGTVVGLVTWAQLHAIGAAHGWTPDQISDWGSLIKSESNGTLTDKNPSSNAIGIAQGITGPGWYAAHGGSFNTVTGQLTAMANYISQRYGNPSAAWAFHKANSWY